MAGVVLRAAMAWLSVAALPWLPACSASEAFACSADAQCVSGEVSGRCELEGVCSFPDEACASGHRYGMHSGALSGECVGAGSSESTTTDVDTTSVSPEETLGVDGSSSGSPATSTSTTDATSTSSTSMTSTTSTTEPDPTNGGLDPYGKCGEDAECPVAGSVCYVNTNASSVCVPPCSKDDPSCLYEVDGNAMASCFPVTKTFGCILVCEDPAQCPPGMTCELEMGLGYCAWP